MADLGPELQEYYKRQISCLGPAALSTLQQKTIALIGCGGLGSHILMTLGNYGIGEIRLIDGDTVTLHNLHRQPLYTMDQEGKKKAVCAKEYFEVRNPHTRFRAFDDYIADHNADSFLKGCDLIIDGTDSHACTNILNNYSIEKATLLIAASVERTKGYVGIFNGAFEGQPCHNCLFPEFPDTVPTCAELGVDPRAVSLTAAIQADLAIACLLGEERVGTVINVDAQNLRVTKTRLQKGTSCPYCSKRRNKPEMKPDDKVEIVQDKGPLKLVDVRSIEEFSANPREAINIPMDAIMADIAILPSEDIILCCASGIRSTYIAQFLLANNWPYKIKVLDQGQPR